MTYEESAQSLLIHYFKRLYETVGLGWNSDNDAEMMEIVDNIKKCCDL